MSGVCWDKAGSTHQSSAPRTCKWCTSSRPSSREWALRRLGLGALSRQNLCPTLFIGADDDNNERLSSSLLVLGDIYSKLHNHDPCLMDKSAGIGSPYVPRVGQRTKRWLNNVPISIGPSVSLAASFSDRDMVARGRREQGGACVASLSYTISYGIGEGITL